MAKSKRMTAEEHEAILRADPEWVRRDAEREAKLKREEAELNAEEQPLVRDLLDAGFIVDSVWDAVNSSQSYAAAIPVLTKHLLLPYHTRIREGIARALTVKEARGAAARVILDELKRRTQPDEQGEFRWTLANALTVAGDKTMADEIKALLADERYQDIHDWLQRVLNKIKRTKPIA